MNTKNGVTILLVSRPFMSMSTSLEIYTYYLYKYVSKALLRSKDVNIQSKLIPHDIHSKKFKVFHRIPYGSILAPATYDYLLPFLSMLRYVSKISLTNVFIIHYLHHILLGVEPMRKVVYAVPAKEALTNIKKITTIHHVPEVLDPEYPAILRTRINEFSKYISDASITRLLNKKLYNLKLSAYDIHDILTFKLAIRYSDILIAVSSLTRQELAIYEKELGKKIYVVNPGLTLSYEIKKIKPIISQSLQREKRRHSDRIVIGYIGTHIPRKATFMLIALGALLKKTLKKANIKIYIWGAGPLLELLYFLASKLEVLDIVEFKGSFQRDELPSILSSLDLLFIPSIKEGFGLPIIEALSIGIPVIIYDDAKIPHEVKKYCRTIKSLNEIPSIIEVELEEIKRRTKVMARRIANDFSWEKAATLLTNIYINEV